MNKLSVGSLFAGMGGFSDGAAQAGMRCAWGTDMDKHVAKTWAHRKPDTTFHTGKLENLLAECHTWKKPDIITAGFPCQSFSRAGLKKGLDDIRGQAMFSMIEATRILHPKALLMENVPGFLKHWHILSSRLADIGYQLTGNTTWLTKLDKTTGIPQIRPRVYMAAYRNDINTTFFQHPFPIADKLLPLEDFIDWKQDHTLFSYEKKTGKTKASLTEALQKHPKQVALHRFSSVRMYDSLLPTLIASGSHPRCTVPVILTDSGQMRSITVSESAKLQGFENVEYLFPSDVSMIEQYKMIGNSTAPPMARFLCQHAVEQITT